MRISGWIAAAALLSCSPHTSVTRAWRDPAYFTHARSFVVFGFGTTERTRRALEDALAAELRKRELRALPSYVVFPRVEDPVTFGALRRRGIDGAILARLAERSEETFPVPATGGDSLVPPITAPPRAGYDTLEFARFDTSLVDVRERERVAWIATETENPGDERDLARSVAQTVASALEDTGIIPKPRKTP